MNILDPWAFKGLIVGTWKLGQTLGEFLLLKDILPEIADPNLLRAAFKMQGYHNLILAIHFFILLLFTLNWFYKLHFLNLSYLHYCIMQILFLVSLWSLFPQNVNLAVGLEVLDLTLLEKSPKLVIVFLFDWVVAAGKSLSGLPCISVVVIFFNFWSLLLIVVNFLGNFYCTSPACPILPTPSNNLPWLPWFHPGTVAFPNPPLNLVLLLILALVPPPGVVLFLVAHRDLVSVALGLLPPCAQNWLLAAIAVDVHLIDDAASAICFLCASVPKRSDFNDYLNLFWLCQSASSPREFLSMFLITATELDLPKKAKMAVLFIAIDPSMTALAPWTMHHDSFELLVSHLVELTSASGYALILKRAPARAMNLAALFSVPVATALAPDIESKTKPKTVPALGPVDIIETSCHLVQSSSLEVLLRADLVAEDPVSVVPP